ncbi:MAG: diguanylate cyclase [Aureliella sp.]
MPSDPVYDRDKSYQWNYANAPASQQSHSTGVKERPLDFDFCGIPVASPLGIAAGPLLNGRWLLSYAGAGFDVLTYKTVRSRQRECYPLPNLVPVSANDVSPGAAVVAQSEMRHSWAISFGMPSAAPEVWSQDVARTRELLPQGCVLCVSVVATPEQDWSLEDIANDYAWCAKLAVESGAQCVEANFSCPNVASRDGQLFQTPTAARAVAKRIRSAVGSTPLILKIGYVEQRSLAEELVDAVGSTVTALSMTNCISATVAGESDAYFDGQPRGIGGAAIRARSQAQVAMFADCIADSASNARDMKIVGVGGIASADHVEGYMAAGAHSVHVATAAMLDRAVAERIKNDLGWN